MAVLDATDVHDGFHATHDALRKPYRYMIDNGPFRDVARRYAWHFACAGGWMSTPSGRAAPLVGPLPRLQQFRNRWAPRKTSVRAVSTCRSARGGGSVSATVFALEVEANGFLYNMRSDRRRAWSTWAAALARRRGRRRCCKRPIAARREPRRPRSVPRQGRVPGMRIATSSPG